MTREDFDALVRKLEPRATANPGRFRWITTGWAFVGFGYLLFVLTITLGGSAAIIAMICLLPNALTIKVGIIGLIVTGGMSIAIIRSLFVRTHAPTGLELKRKDVPELFAAIDELRAQLHAPRFHRVLLTPEHNAAVVQVPRLGVFGWHCNYLILGLPLLQGVSRDEARAILAHEFAHLSGSHGKFGMWLYRLRRTWEGIFERLHRQQQKGTAILTRFLDWYWPRFNARAFVLSRAQEYEADATAARLVGAVPLGCGLIRTQVGGRWMEETFWPRLLEGVKSQPEPPRDVYDQLGGAILRLHEVPELPRWLTQAYKFETDNSDTHPCLKDRLRALPGRPETLPVDLAPSELPPFTGPDAATAFLSTALPSLRQKLQDEWAGNIARAWSERHTETQKLSSELEAVADTEQADAATLWKRAQLLLDRDGDEGAQPAVLRVLQLEPAHVEANFVRGRYLLAEENEEGLACIERAIAENPIVTPNGLEIMAAYYARNGHRDQLKELQKRHDDHQELSANAQQERNNVTARDTFLPPDLTPEQLEEVRTIAAAHPAIGALHVARKQVQYFPKSPLFVVCITVKVPWWKPRSSSANRELVYSVLNKLTLPGHSLVFIYEKELKKMGEKLMRLTGTEAYRRG